MENQEVAFDQTSVSESESKEQLIERLMQKAELDFSCCGHGKDKTSAEN